MITTRGKELAAIRLGSNISGIAYVGIGSGSGAVLSSNLILAAETDRNALTSTDYSTPTAVVFTADWSSTEISGTVFKEYGLFQHSTANTGSAWQREALTGSIVFTGNSEMRLESTWTVY